MNGVFLKKNKEFFGNSFDKKSGFIHLSTKKQLNKTIDLYFNNNTKLIILKFNVKKFGKDLKWRNLGMVNFSSFIWPFKLR